MPFMSGNINKIGIAIPCYNEEGNVELVYRAVTEQMKQMPEYTYEILFVDNCSLDRTPEILRAIVASDKHVKVIFNLRNFGAERSGMHSFYQSDGDAVISMACDLQTPVELIPVFIKEWEKGAKVVWGQKADSEESWIMWKTRSLYYYIIKKFSNVQQYNQITGFGLYDREVVELIRKTDDPMPLLRNVVPELGFEPVLIPYKQPARHSGKSSYNFFSYYDIAMLSLVNTSRAPMHLATLIGFIIAGSSFLLGLLYLILKIAFWEFFPMGTAPILIGMFFLGAIQLLFVGIIGEYVGEVLSRLRHYPRVVERERLNFETDEKSSS